MGGGDVSGDWRNAPCEEVDAAIATHDVREDDLAADGVRRWVGCAGRRGEGGARAGGIHEGGLVVGVMRRRAAEEG